MKTLAQSFKNVLTDTEVTDRDKVRVFLCLFAIVGIILLLEGLKHPHLTGNF